jgi:hypothetical protein
VKWLIERPGSTNSTSSDATHPEVEVFIIGKKDHVKDDRGGFFRGKLSSPIGTFVVE